MLRFTESKDGKLRATVKTQHRVAIELLYEAAGLCVRGDDDPADSATRLTKSQIEDELRYNLKEWGSGDGWPENHGSLGELNYMNACRARVDELYGPMFNAGTSDGGMGDG